MEIKSGYFEKRQSNGEKEVIEYIKELLPKVRIYKNDRKLIAPKEVDIYIPSKKIAIEFNGIYFHSIGIGKKEKNYHLDKLKKCNDRGIKLIQIWDIEWINKKEIIKNIIRNLLVPEKNIIKSIKYLTVKLISDKIANNFLENYHLKGSDTSNIQLGLYYNTELLAIMTFKNKKLGKGLEWKLSRYVVKFGISIPGGAKKLFNYFLKEYNPKRIVAFSDNRLFGGSLYKKLGFIFESAIKPTFYYTDYINIYLNRRDLTKFKIKIVDKIYDCGENKWSFFKKNTTY